MKRHLWRQDSCERVASRTKTKYLTGSESSRSRAGSRVRQAGTDRPRVENASFNSAATVPRQPHPHPSASRRSFCRWCRSSSEACGFPVLDSQGTSCFPFRILVQVRLKHGLVGTAGALNPAPGGCDLGRSSGRLGSVKVPEAGGGDGRSVQGFSLLPSRLLPSAQPEAGIVNENSSKCSKRAFKKNTSVYAKLTKKEGCLSSTDF